MSLTFFATDIDLLEVWRRILSIPGMKVLEEYSVPDQPNRLFETVDAVADELQKPAPSLAACFEPSGGQPRAEAIRFTTEARAKIGARGRTILCSPALVKIHRHGEQAGCLAFAQVSSWTEQGAYQRSSYDDRLMGEVDWKLFRSTVGKLERSIKKSAHAKLNSCFILPDAYEGYLKGRIKLWNFGEVVRHPSPRVTELIS